MTANATFFPAVEFQIRLCALLILERAGNIKLAWRRLRSAERLLARHRAEILAAQR